ncbi:methyltransferase domain-containing protein [Pseudomonadota bacterium]
MVNIVCPVCKQPLDNKSNVLTCDAHGTFNLFNDVPILMKNASTVNAEYFKGHWQERIEVEYAESKLQVARDFLQPLKSVVKEASIEILDAGCGDGVHANVINEFCGDSFSLSGVDISLPAACILKHRHPTSTAINADVRYLPFEDEAFDVVFSYGVLAYTESPADSFKELCRTTKKEGVVGVWFYPKPSSIFLWSILSTVRWIGKVLPKPVIGMIANVIVPFLPILPTSSKVNLSNATWAQCKEVVMVNVAPADLWYPTKDDIISLFERNGIEIFSIEEEVGISVWGEKK